jgi:hypothetical protein
MPPQAYRLRSRLPLKNRNDSKNSLSHGVYMEVSVVNAEASSWNRGDGNMLHDAIDRERNDITIAPNPTSK